MIKINPFRKIILKMIFFPVLIMIFSSGCAEIRKERNFDPVELVSPLMGTDSEFRLSNGNTYPAIALPWGMNFWTPQTRPMGNGWGYTYDDYKIMGIKQTHQPSPWINDYAAFSLMPVTGKLRIKEDERASWFSHKAEVVKPYYYSVYLADHDVTAEVTPTERAAIFRFTFPANDSSYHPSGCIQQRFDGEDHYPESERLSGIAGTTAGGVPENFHNYFVAIFDKEFSSSHTWNGDALNLNKTDAEGEHTGAVLGFKTTEGEVIHVRVASSFISPEQAELNLKRETEGKDFLTIMNEGKKIWNNQLKRIKVEGGTLDQQRTFYSCLYRMILFPRSFYEIDEKNDIVHYSPYNGKVLPGYMYTDNGFWDTFRSLFPFTTLMYPEVNSRIMEGLVNTYKESGWLPGMGKSRSP